MFDKEDYLKKSLKRVLDEIINIQEKRENLSRSSGLIEKYNETVSLAKESIPNYTMLNKYTETIGEDFFGKHNVIVGTQILKSRVTSIIDSMGIDISELNKITSTIPSIQLNQNISQFQLQQQTTDIKNITETVNNLEIVNENKLELLNCIKEFDQEIKKSNPDKSKISEILKKIKSYNNLVFTQILTYAVTKGLDWILQLIKL